MTEKNTEHFDLTRDFVHPNLKNYVRNSRAWNIIPCGKKVLDYLQVGGIHYPAEGSEQFFEWYRIEPKVWNFLRSYFFTNETLGSFFHQN